MTGTVRSSSTADRMVKLVPSATNSLFHGTGETKAETRSLFDVTPLFEGAPASVKKIKPAALPVLFSHRYESMARTTSSQPHHFALSAPGIRREPIVHRTENYFFERSDQFSVRADRRFVYIADSTEQTMVVVDTETKAVSTFSPANGHDASVPRNAVVTRDGLAFSWDFLSDRILVDGWRKFERTLMVTHLDRQTQRILWSRALFKGTGNETVDFLGCLPEGDLIAIYGIDRIYGEESTYTRIRRFDATTGDEVFDKPCPWPGVEYGGYLSAQKTGKFQFHFYDEKTNTAVIGLLAVGDKQAVQFFEVNFENGEIKKVGNKITTYFSLLAQSELTNSRILLQDGVNTSVLNRDSKGQITLLPFDSRVEAAFPMMVSADGALAVQARAETLSFFTVGDDRLTLVTSVNLPEGFKIDPLGRRHDENAALTADNVYYCSATNTEGESPRTRRLLAYDATTGELLWELDEPFLNTPTLSINLRGTITWLDNTKALILEEPL